jgi:tungstate transport system substrate-binding protein
MSRHSRIVGASLAVAALLASAFGGACRRGPGDGRRLVLATTTSVRDCGLLDVLIPAFEKEAGLRVAPIAVGSGEAMRMGRDGNADVLLVHDPQGEAKLVAEGVVAEDVEIMRSRFVVVGPASDPAGIRGLRDGAGVFRAVGRAGAGFVSRGDDSGTHRLEKRLWTAARFSPEGAEWYVSVGAGMVHALRVANEKQAYCLTDVATWLRAARTLDLVVLVDSDAPEWANVYSVLLLSPDRYPKVDHDGARRFRDFLAGGAGRGLIREFGRREFGAAVFEVPYAPAAAPR